MYNNGCLIIVSIGNYNNTSFNLVNEIDGIFGIYFYINN